MYTHNPMLGKSMNNMGYFCGVSGLAQYILARALEDRAWVDMYLTENAHRLGASYNILAGESVLDHSAPAGPGCAGQGEPSASGA